MVAFGDIWRVNYKSKNRHIYLYVELFPELAEVAELVARGAHPSLGLIIKKGFMETA